MSSYNDSKYIEDAIVSVLNSTFTEWELIIVDDCSSDETVAIAEKYVKLDSRITLLKRDKCSGSPIVPRNTGVSQAKGDYILFFDADDLITTSCLEKMHAAMELGIADVVTTQVKTFGLSEEILKLPEPIAANFKEENCASCFSLIKKEDFLSVGGFDEGFKDWFEDWELWLSFVENGKTFYRINEPLFHYRIKSDSRNKRNQSFNSDRSVARKSPEILKKHSQFFDEPRLSDLGFKNLISLMWCRIIHSKRTYNEKRKHLIREIQYPNQTALNPKLIMVILVKNEQDIIRENLEFHKEMGVDGFIVTDNNSSDNTKSILKEYVSKGWILDLIDEPSDNYDQKAWCHRMILLAKNKYKADWIISADADEFWFENSGNLKNSIKQDLNNLIYVPMYNVKDENKKWSDNVNLIAKSLDDAAIKELVSEGKLSPFNQYGRQIPKVIIRASSYIHIHMGNHSADILGANSESLSETIKIYHFSSRGKDHFFNKMVGGGMAVSRNKDENEKVATHWRYYLKKYHDGAFDLDEEYDLFTGKKCQNLLDKLLKEDKTIYDFVRYKEIEAKFPKLISYGEMLSKIINGASLARFGDAEFDTAFLNLNPDDPYQKFDDELSEKLKEVISYPSDEKLMVCIPPLNPKNNNPKFRGHLKFWPWYWLQRWENLNKYFTNEVYGNSLFSRDAVFHELPLQQLKEIWNQRKVVFVYSKQGRFVYDERLFSNIREKREVFIPATHAFSEYSRILEECSTFSKEYLFFLSGGPTATVLAFDLMKMGYQALDMGHFPNCYQQYLGEAAAPETQPMKKEV